MKKFCNYCLSEIEFPEGSNIVTCPACGRENSLTQFEQPAKHRAQEKLALLYQRAEDLQNARRFPEAKEKYLEVIENGGGEPEVFWRVLMCHYGVEYMLEDENDRKLTMYMPDLTAKEDMPEQKNLLESLKNESEDVRRRYLARLDELNGIIQKYREVRFRESYDVFISVKQNDRGKPTPDCVKAINLYDMLRRWGLTVFNSAKTILPAGEEYEPHIISALMSAKVLVVVGTKKEYMESKWVQNEWRRFQWLKKNDPQKKRLLFCYLADGMKASDIPSALNPSIQAIVEGVDSESRLRKIMESAFPENERLNPRKNPGKMDEKAQQLLKKAFELLNAGAWDEADAICKELLQDNVQNGQVYLCRMMIDLRVRSRKDLPDLSKPFDQNLNYQKAMHYGDASLKEELLSALSFIHERSETTAKIYAKAVSDMQYAKSEDEFREIAETFRSISGYKSADELRGQCLKKADYAHKSDVYRRAVNWSKNSDVASQNEAIQLFVTIPGWEDADEQAEICRRRIAKIKAEQFQSKVNSPDYDLPVVPPDSDFVVKNVDGDCGIAKYTGSLPRIRVPESIHGRKVVLIGASAFHADGLLGNQTLLAVYIPDTVREIEKNAFQGCRKLSRVVFGVDDGAPEGTVNIPRSVRFIGDGAFNLTAIREANLCRGTEFSANGFSSSFPKSCAVFVREAPDGQPAPEVRYQNYKPDRKARSPLLILLLFQALILLILPFEFYYDLFWLPLLVLAAEALIIRRSKPRPYLLLLIPSALVLIVRLFEMY